MILQPGQYIRSGSPRTRKPYKRKRLSEADRKKRAEQVAALVGDFDAARPVKR